MIDNLSKKLTARLLKKGVINDEEQELYIYALFILISSLMYLVLVGILGLILNCFFESIIFFIAFQFIRKYAGGYHASTETRCEIMSTLSMIASVVIIKLAKAYDFKTILLCVAVAAALLITVFCPLDTPEKLLSKKEFRYFRKISWIILAIIFSAVVVSYCFSVKILFAPCCVSLILESILITAGKIKQKFSIKKLS